ncbi:MAG: 50S ribosomal protein L13 [Clostridia bacterium]|nr:50S ribosomal protein L13 [Clostridia bacterium]
MAYDGRTYRDKGEPGARRWYVVDAKGLVLGRLASEIARVLRGKHKPTFTPGVDTGDHVIVVNAREVRLTGQKPKKKIYYRHSGWPRGLKAMDYEAFLARWPERAVRKAVAGMLPRTPLGRRMLKKLRVYAGPEHPHAAQKPEPLPLRRIRKARELASRAAEEA